MLILTRFGETRQVHGVKMPDGARRQMTFFEDAVGLARYRPGDPDTVIVTKGEGGNEQSQIYRLDLRTGAITLLTDGKSRNDLTAISPDGNLIGFSSNRRSPAVMDLYTMDLRDPASARRVMEGDSGSWIVADFSRDNSRLLLLRRISMTESQIWMRDAGSGNKTLLTPETPAAAYSTARFTADGKGILFTSDAGGEIHQLQRMSLDDRKQQTLTSERWELGGFRPMGEFHTQRFALSADRTKVAYVTNENGAHALRILDLASGARIPGPKLPLSHIMGLEWHANGRLVGFTVSHARAPGDVYSFDVGDAKLERWTEGEVGGLNPERNREPQIVTVKSFDGTNISAFVYRPDRARFPGKRPAIIEIHGGPETQSTAGFLSRTNYWINELGIGLVVPNIRGSSGYGRTPGDGRWVQAERRRARHRRDPRLDRARPRL